MRTILGLVSLISSLFVQVAVGEVYRSVDEAGNVTFSDTPSSDASTEQIELPPGPSPQSLRESEQRNREIRRAADQAQRERLQEKRQQQGRIEAAQQRLQEAQAKLAEAKVIKDEDRQNLVGEKRRIHPAYFERVKQAKAAVEEARKALREARGY